MSALDKQIELDVSQALQEDLGEGDVSAQIIDKSQTSTAKLVTREDIILCGTSWFERAFNQLNQNININWQFADGDKVLAEQVICTIQGNTRAILSAERVAMNFLQTLSATASETHKYVSKIERYQTQILDTRKTIPGLRLAQKYAVKIGGGINHRMGLYDAFLLKENHIGAAGGVSQAILAARKLKINKKIQVEVETLKELEQALAVKPDQILLDNFSLTEIKQAVVAAKDKVVLEVSGNVDITNVESYAKAGVDYISIGALTKNIQAVDLSLRID